MQHDEVFYIPLYTIKAYVSYMYVKVWDCGDDPLKIISTLRIPNTAAQLLVPQDFMRALKLKKGDLVEYHISEIHRIKPDNPKKKKDSKERIVK